MPFDPCAALAHARALSRPRRVGSGEDEVVAGEIEDRLRGSGYRVEREPFEFSTGVNVFVNFLLAGSMSLVAASLWLREMKSPAAIAPALMILLPVLLSNRLLRAAESGSLAPLPGAARSLWTALCLRLGARHRSANVVATRDSRVEPSSQPHLYLVAHYDSKSQHIPLVVRVALFAVAFGGGLVFIALNLLALVFTGLDAAIVALGGAVALAIIPLLFVGAGNDSPGAIDNASGVGVVLHLAECLASHADVLDRLGVTILITSAEELALMGAAAHVHRHQTELRRQASQGGLYILNFDGVGVDGDLRFDARDQARAGRLTSLVGEAGAELGLPLRRFALPGLLFDHMPFARRGFDALTLIGLGRATWSIHTRADSADRLHPRGFEQAGRVAWRVIEKLSASAASSSTAVRTPPRRSDTG